MFCFFARIIWLPSLNYNFYNSCKSLSFAFLPDLYDCLVGVVNYDCDKNSSFSFVGWVLGVFENFIYIISRIRQLLQSIKNRIHWDFHVEKRVFDYLDMTLYFLKDHEKIFRDKCVYRSINSVMELFLF
jgi:hypothetical protein